MRWAGLLRRSEFFGNEVFVWGWAVREWYRGRLLRPAVPAFVEGPELFGFQFERTGDVEGIEGADAEGRAISPGEVDAGFPSSRRKSHFNPDTMSAIALEITPYMIRIRRGEPLQKHLLKERVCQFGATEVSEPTETLPAMHASTRTECGVRDVA